MLLAVAARTVLVVFLAKWLVQRIRRQTVPYTLRKHIILIPAGVEQARGAQSLQRAVLNANRMGHKQLPPSHSQYRRLTRTAERIMPHALGTLGTPICAASVRQYEVTVIVIVL